MNLRHVASTNVTPVTAFYWDTETATLVETTSLTDAATLVRASKTFRICKQDVEGQEQIAARSGQENWDSNLWKLNEYLADAVPRFRLTLNYDNEVTPQVTGIAEEVQELAETATDLQTTHDQTASEVEALTQARDRDHGSPTIQDVLARKTTSKQQELENVEAKLDRLTERLARKREEANEWQTNGVMQSLTFTFSTAPVITSRTVEPVIANHISKAETHAEHVRQSLERGHLKLVVEPVTEPRVLHRLEHTNFLSPPAYHTLIEKHPDLADRLKQLRQQVVSQYDAYALEDLTVDGQVVERAKATPAQATAALLQDLEAQNVAMTRAAPNDGPMIGTVAGLQQVVGFDPAAYFNHLYLAGRTGVGKSYLKRVLLEAAAACGANILSITPTDTEALGAAFPYDDDGTALAADYYWPETKYGCSWPSDPAELLTGLNFVSLDDVGASLTTDLLVDVLSDVFESKYSADEPLFIGLDEAQALEGEAKDQLMKVVKQKRKHNIHVIIATQSPMQFKRAYSDIRENTTTVFLRGEYFNYAEDFTTVLESKHEIASLERGQAILQSMDLDRVTVDVRPPISQVTEPTEEQLSKLQQRYQQTSTEPPAATDFEGSQSVRDSATEHTRRDAELSEVEAEVLDWVAEFISTESYEYVTARNCWAPDEAPTTSRNAESTLQSLVDKERLETTEITRNGNDTRGYRLCGHQESADG